MCVPDASPQGYSCQCPDGYAGASCELDISKCHDDTCYIPRNPISFSGSSSAQYRIDKAVVKRALENEMRLSLRIRTVQQTGNLLYAAGKVDFNSLEVDASLDKGLASTRHSSLTVRYSHFRS